MSLTLHLDSGCKRYSWLCCNAAQKLACLVVKCWGTFARLQLDVLGQHSLCELPTCHDGGMHSKAVGYEQMGLLLSDHAQPSKVLLCWRTGLNSWLPSLAAETGIGSGHGPKKARKEKVCFYKSWRGTLEVEAACDHGYVIQRVVLAFQHRVSPA